MAWDWGAIANAAVSLYSANRAADAAKDAGRQSAAGADASNALMRYMYDQDVARQQPFYQAGLQGLNEYMALMGLGGQQGAAYGQAGGTGPQVQGWRVGPAMTAEQAYLAANPDVARDAYFGNKPLLHYQKYGQAEGRKWGVMPTQNQAQPTKTPQQLQQEAFAKFRATPGYQFGLDEGRGQIEASAAARGGLNSGATLKALQRYGNDYADQQGFTPYMNRLASLFGGAQTSANNMSQSGQYYGGQMGQNMQNAANARANSTYQQNNAWQQGLGNAAYFGGQAYDSWRNG